MQDPNLPALLQQLADPTPYLVIGGLAVTFAGVITATFTIYFLLLLPFALARGEIGANARTVLRDLLSLFHALIDCIKHRGPRR